MKAKKKILKATREKHDIQRRKLIRFDGRQETLERSTPSAVKKKKTSQIRIQYAANLSNKSEGKIRQDKDILR